MVELRAVWNRPRLYRPGPAQTRLFPGLYSLGDLVEDPAGSHLYPFATVGATIPVLTARPDAQAPFVDVLIDVVPDEVDRLTVWRQQDGRWMPVRGGVGVRNVGGWTGRDYEAGFDRELTYRVQYYRDDGQTVGFSDTATVTLRGPGGWWTWVHDPIDPAGALKVEMLAGFAGTLSRPSRGALTSILGQSVLVLLSGARAGLVEVPLAVLTRTRAAADAFDLMVGGYDDTALGVLCFRTPYESRLPGALFAWVTVESSLVGPRMDLARWAITGTEVDPPTPAVVTPAVTYEDFEAAYLAYSQFTATYGSYLDAERDDTVREGA